MNHLELPLVFFTILTQAAIGLALMSTIRQWAIADGPATGGNLRLEWAGIAALFVLGIIASFFHLGHPLGAVRMAVNWELAWLSREIIAMGLFGALVAVTLFTVYQQNLNKWLFVITAAVGLIAVFAMGMTYAPPSMPAIDNYLPFLFFLLTVMILGPAIAVYFTSEAWQPLLTYTLATSLIVALVVFLIVPSLWFSGGTVTQMTAEAYLTSPLYWTRIVVGLAVPLAVLAWQRRIPLWLPLLLIVGEFAGRIIFFTETVSSAANLGGLY